MGGPLWRAPQKTTHTVGSGTTITDRCDPQVESNTAITVSKKSRAVHAILFSTVAGLLNHPFLKKLQMFNKFIKRSVTIAGKLEEISIGKDELRLTRMFEDSHPNAGKGGDFVFQIALKVMTIVSYASGAFFFWRFVVDLGKC